MSCLQENITYEISQDYRGIFLIIFTAALCACKWVLQFSILCEFHFLGNSEKIGWKDRRLNKYINSWAYVILTMNLEYSDYCSWQYNYSGRTRSRWRDYIAQPCFHSHRLVLVQVRKELGTLFCSRGASYTLWQECMKPVLTLMGQTSLQSRHKGTDVQIPLHACRKTKCTVCHTKPRLLQTLVLALNNPQSPKTSPTPNCRCTYTHICAQAPPVQAPCHPLNSCSLTIHTPKWSNNN